MDNQQGVVLKSYKITFCHDRDGAIAETEVNMEYPRIPDWKMWEEVDIGDEIYWKIEVLNDIIYIRKSFLYCLRIEEVK